MKKKSMYLALALVVVMVTAFSSVGLASMLGINAVAAAKIIDIIDTASTALTVVSIVATIVGAGVISTGLVALAKQMIKTYGKKYAKMW